MKPLKNLIHVKPDEKPEKTESGIYTGKPTWDTPPNTGEVVTVGPDVKDFIQGQRVIFNAYALMEVNLGKEKNYLIRDTDILGTL